ncbi:dysbindin-A isoform X3 [Carcharodon carcharias]|uniref:dysbindin-A isoform X3 n=1 Tax=Carcharodon carcharias TaxID=13397 RepID=UPI001B7F0A0A|nr:dysbindin-A isoform X3 [Carcharodon carcharias]
MFENFKERLLSAQQDLSSGLKTLSDKSKEVKIKKPSSTDDLPKFTAGAELLSRYENTWATLHKQAEDSAKVGEAVDGKVVVLSAYWEKKRNHLIELQEQLHQIPALLVGLDTLTSRLAQLEAGFEELEGHLHHLEDICEQCELERYKQLQILQLENYKKEKRKKIEALKEPIGSMSSMEVNVDMLEQMDLMDISDQEALDVFLNSGGEDNSEISPVLGSGSEPEPYQREITLQVPSQAELRLKLSSLSSPSADDDTPLVQSDEEEVQIDTSLVTNSDLKENADSDSQ